MSGITWGLLTPDQIAAGQRALAADAAGVDASVKACASADQALLDAWAAFYQTVQAFCAEKPVWFFPWSAGEVLTTRGLAFQWQTLSQELYAWKQKLSTRCALAVPQGFDPTAPPPPDPNAILASSAVKYLAVGAIFVSTAVVVGGIIARIPKPARRVDRIRR